ncbi:ABC-2 type transport system permease protein [Microbacterium sp. ZKA21]|uniref:ABC transporter permease n=1 Tax=Microbacterium sp. ZKA21 TaxID=3381694 RepID=UPI003D22F873
MSTLTASAPRRATHVESPYRLNFLRILRSEWIKLATLRSTWWSIGITAALTIGIAVLVAQSMTAAPGFEPIQAVVSPVQFTMLLAGILGAISVTGEYSTGMIRSTLTAVPVRGSVLLAKAIVVGLVLFVSSVVIFVTAALVVTPMFTDTAQPFDWGTPSASTLPILATSLAMAVFALLGVAFGFMLRSGAGAIAATVGLLLVLPLVANIFAMPGEGWEWIADASAHLPMSAAQSIILPQDDWGLPVGEAYLTLAAWVTAGLLGAWAVLRTRDA